MKYVTKFPSSPINYERVIRKASNTNNCWIYEFDGFFWRMIRKATNEEVSESNKNLNEMEKN